MAFEPEAARREPSGAQAFLVFLLVPIAVVALELAIVLCLMLAWTDVFHVNPHRTTGDVVALMALSSLYGLCGAVVLAGAPVLLGAALASAAVAVSGRLSPVAIACIVVLGAGLFLCGCYVASDAVLDDPSLRRSGPPWPTLVGGPIVLTSAWLVARRALLRVAAW